jgi:putative PIN family toxin of toxin-antitoxin system
MFPPKLFPFRRPSKSLQNEPCKRRNAYEIPKNPLTGPRGNFRARRFITKELLNEINDVIMRPKFHTDENEINYFINSIEEIANKIVPKRRINDGSRDKTENKYIECGIAAHVDYIISGDIHLLEIEEYENIKIITAKEYWTCSITRLVIEQVLF